MLLRLNNRRLRLELPESLRIILKQLLLLLLDFLQPLLQVELLLHLLPLSLLLLLIQLLLQLIQPLYFLLKGLFILLILPKKVELPLLELFSHAVQMVALVQEPLLLLFKQRLSPLHLFLGLLQLVLPQLILGLLAALDLHLHRGQLLAVLLHLIVQNLQPLLLLDHALQLVQLQLVRLLHLDFLELEKLLFALDFGFVHGFEPLFLEVAHVRDVLDLLLFGLLFHLELFLEMLLLHLELLVVVLF